MADRARVEKIDGLIVDLDGVVWVGETSVPGAIGALQRLAAAGIGIVYLTNDPQSTTADHVARLAGLGAPVTPDSVVTSTSALAEQLAGQAHLTEGYVLAIGSAAMKEELRIAGLRVLDSYDDTTRASSVVVTAHRDLHYRELAAATSAVLNGAPLFAPGRDPRFPVSGGFAPGTGAIVAAVETATGVRATNIGKPEPLVFRAAARRLGSRRKVAVVGDNLAADIAGGRNAGLATALVLTGVTSRDDLAISTIAPDLVVDDLPTLAHVLLGDPEATAVVN